MSTDVLLRSNLLATFPTPFKVVDFEADHFTVVSTTETLQLLAKAEPTVTYSNRFTIQG